MTEDISLARLCSWENLLKAWQNGSRGKRGQAAVAAFEHRLEDNLIALQIELQSQAYRPGAYTSFFVHEPKRRLISAAPFRDRVVHHALCQIIEPTFERSFVAASYANRVGKGTHRALDHLQQLARRHRYALQCDVRQFFPSIDHEILLTVLERKIFDPDIRRLIQLILASGSGVLRDEYDMVWFPNDDLFAPLRARGVPIGNLTSQFWANCYLNAFDHFVTRELRCSAYVRYVDDCVLMADSKRSLWTWKAEIIERLARVRLTIHAHAVPRPVKEGIPFLGFVVYPDRRRLKRRKGVYSHRKLRDLARDVVGGNIPLSEFTSSLRSWINHVRYANTVGLRKAILKDLRITPARPQSMR